MAGGTAVVGSGRNLTIRAGGCLSARQTSACMINSDVVASSVLSDPPAMLQGVDRAPAAADEGPGAIVTLNFGGLPYAIYVENNATLTLNDTFLTGIPYGASYLNNTFNSQYGLYPVPGLALFPSISTEPGANVRPRPSIMTQACAPPLRPRIARERPSEPSTCRLRRVVGC